MAQYINKDTYVGDTNTQLKDIKTNKDNLTNLNNDVSNLKSNVNSLLYSRGKWYKMRTGQKVYTTSSAWNWLDISDRLTVNADGYYLCIFNAWVQTQLGSEMDLRFTRNNSIQSGCGSALGGSASCVDIFWLNAGDTVGVKMQTSGTGSTNIYDGSLVAVKVD